MVVMQGEGPPFPADSLFGGLRYLRLEDIYLLHFPGGALSADWFMVRAAGRSAEMGNGSAELHAGMKSIWSESKEQDCGVQAADFWQEKGTIFLSALKGPDEHAQ
jgi:hypothetical protein